MRAVRVLGAQTVGAIAVMTNSGLIFYTMGNMNDFGKVGKLSSSGAVWLFWGLMVAIYGVMAITALLVHDVEEDVVIQRDRQARPASSSFSRSFPVGVLGAVSGRLGRISACRGCQPWRALMWPLGGSRGTHAIYRQWRAGYRRTKLAKQTLPSPRRLTSSRRSSSRRPT